MEKMKLFVESQLVKMNQMFHLEDHEENPDDNETEDIILNGDGDEELIQGGGNRGKAGTPMWLVTIVIDGEQQITV